MALRPSDLLAASKHEPRCGLVKFAMAIFRDPLGGLCPRRGEQSVNPALPRFTACFCSLAHTLAAAVPELPKRFV
jgi:hypothetical protein